MEWISVEDRLPDDRHIGMNLVTWVKLGTAFNRPIINWWTSAECFDVYPGQVTHWMPLPPPQEGE